MVAGTPTYTAIGRCTKRLEEDTGNCLEGAKAYVSLIVQAPSLPRGKVKKERLHNLLVPLMETVYGRV